MPEIVLLINYSSKFDETSQKDEAQLESMSCKIFRVLRLRSEVKIVYQQ